MLHINILWAIRVFCAVIKASYIPRAFVLLYHLKYCFQEGDQGCKNRLFLMSEMPLLCSLLLVVLAGHIEIHVFVAFHQTGDLLPLIPCHSLTESHKWLSLSYKGLIFLVVCNYPIQKILAFQNYCRIYYKKHSCERKTRKISEC